MFFVYTVLTLVFASDIDMDSLNLASCSKMMFDADAE